METPPTFETLGLAVPLVSAVIEKGYETPTPIQARAIPALLSGRDLIGQAQTGTGKTAAFGLPLLQAVDPRLRAVQALVLTPTRELASQVCETLAGYGRKSGVRVLPIYGGQSFKTQLEGLRRGAHVIVGTPGRVLDHLNRKSLRLDGLRVVVLDEADEMLKMGFREDVEAILAHGCEEHQTALFSATLSPEVLRVARRHLNDPVRVEVAGSTLTVATVDQRVIRVAPGLRVEALARILETEPVVAALVFVRTRAATVQVAEALEGRGWAAEALSGDLSQGQRENLVRRLRAGKIRVVVATDVAARGLDVDHVSHVINFDLPHDREAYVHRIGRTGRAGKSGVAVTFAGPRDGYALQAIERHIRCRLRPVQMPSGTQVVARRVAGFQDRIRSELEVDGLEPFRAVVAELVEKDGLDPLDVAAGLVRLSLGTRALVPPADPKPRHSKPASKTGSDRPRPDSVRLYLAAGRERGVRPADVVGAIANEAGVPGREIGPVDVRERYTLVGVPRRYRNRVLERMADSTIRGCAVRIRVDGAPPPRGGRPDARSARKGGRAV